MTDRQFNMRLACLYEQPDNTVAELGVENFEDDEWREFDLNTKSPGFLIFVYAMFTCQHTYMRTNCAERGLLLESATGSIAVTTTEDWDLQRIHFRFDARLGTGSASDDDTDYIVGRMAQCPVSRNIGAVPDIQTELRFESLQ